MNMLSQICKTIHFTEMGDERGNLVVIEGNQDIPFEIKRENDEEGFLDTLKSFSKKSEYSSFAEIVNHNTD